MSVIFHPPHADYLPILLLTSVLTDTDNTIHPNYALGFARIMNYEFLIMNY